MNKQIKIGVVLLMTAMLLTGGAMAKSENQKFDDEQQCNVNDENVKEEVIGLSPDGKDILIKRTISHPVKSKDKKLSYTSNCYKLMGIKWAVQNVPYVINPTNSNAGNDEIVSSFTMSGSTWDMETSRALFGVRTID